MTVSAISSSTISPAQSNSPWAQLRQTFLQLTQSINAGDLTDAQQAYATLTQLRGSTQGSPSNSPLAQALDQIGQSLQNNDISGAQQALASLQQQTQGAHHHRHHHHGGGAASSTSSVAPAAPADGSSSTDSNLVDLTV